METKKEKQRCCCNTTGYGLKVTCLAHALKKRARRARAVQP